jgi:hypothetical protein
VVEGLLEAIRDTPTGESRIFLSGAFACSGANFAEGRSWDQPEDMADRQGKRQHGQGND